MRKPASSATQDVERWVNDVRRRHPFQANFDAMGVSVAPRRRRTRALTVNSDATALSWSRMVPSTLAAPVPGTSRKSSGIGTEGGVFSATIFQAGHSSPSHSSTTGRSARQAQSEKQGPMRIVNTSPPAAVAPGVPVPMT